MQTRLRTVLLLFLVALWGCGSGSAGTISIQPSRVSLTTGQQQVFSVTVTHCTDTHVNWSVQEGSAGGSISSDGVYTAPSTTGVYHVHAECDSDRSVYDLVEVTVN